ncbi:MAG: hypothetical protein ACM31C_19950 [Acidobacteriota bacterium]
MFLSLVLVAIAVGLAYRGWSYYQLPMEDRPGHPDFRALKPSGTWGAGYGWIAAMLIVLNLSYLIRRRFGSAKLGSMAKWLDIHVFTGLVASVLVSFHSSFQVRTPTATIGTVSLTLVVLTGLLGRFLYALAPSGSRERLRAALDGMDAVMPGSRDGLAEAISQRPGPEIPANASLLRSLTAIPSWKRAGRVRRECIAMMLPRRKQLTKPQRRAAKELALAATIDARAAGMAALLRSWRGLHRFFALLMLAAVLLHAGVAWHYGYGRWIFA